MATWTSIYSSLYSYINVNVTSSGSSYIYCSVMRSWQDVAGSLYSYVSVQPYSQMLCFAKVKRYIDYGGQSYTTTTWTEATSEIYCYANVSV